MKLLILIVIFGFATLGCRDEKEKKITGEFSIEEIAFNPAYHEYRMAILHKANLIGQSLFDLDGITTLIIKEQKGICDISDQHLANVKGGILYKETDCKIQSLVIALDKTYPGIWFLDKSTLRQIYDLYRSSSASHDNAIQSNINSILKSRNNENTD
jgi:hypothetical protein